jgi:N-acetylglucosamine-6-phosphate deacetylase
MAALGMGRGRYVLGDLAVNVDETSARLDDGRLAGSILSLDQAVRNLIAYSGCTLADALKSVTTVPAELMGLADRGRCAPRYFADLTLLTPDNRVAATIIGGQVVWQSREIKWD